MFRGDGKIYEASAARMFRVPVDSIGKKSPLRQKGKIAELACGFGGGEAALIAMGAGKAGLSDGEIREIVAQWRLANPRITDFWREINAAAMTAITRGDLVTVRRKLKIYHRAAALIIRLPSSRELVYPRARIVTNRFGGKSIAFEGPVQSTKKWGVQETYGGKLTENVVQAIARDCFAGAMLDLHRSGHKIVMHVHDEAVIEHDAGKPVLEDVIEVMSRSPRWAPDLPLSAEGFETGYYKKN